MEFYEVDMKGDFHNERLSTLPTWTAADEGRIVYAEDVDRLYLGNDIGWRDITSTLSDGDGDTKIQVEETADEDIIRFDVGGTGNVLVLTSSAISGTLIKDEDTFASDSASHLATQQSIKAYIDSHAIAHAARYS